MRHSGFPLAARRRRSPSPTRPRTADASIRTPAAAASTPAASPVISAFHVDFFGIHTVAVGESCIRLWSLKGGPCRHEYRTPSRAVSVSKTGGLHRNPYLLFAGGQDGSLFTFVRSALSWTTARVRWVVCSTRRPAQAALLNAAPMTVQST